MGETQRCALPRFDAEAPACWRAGRSTAGVLTHMVRRRYSRPLRPFLLCVHTRTAKDELTKLVQCFPVGHAVGDRRVLLRALLRALIRAA